MIKLLKEHLNQAQNRMKLQADKHRSEREFIEGEWVYKTRPYRQQIESNNPYQNLSAKYYGPFQILAKVGKVAYALNLPQTAKSHNVFNISLLRKDHGSHPLQQQVLMVTEEGNPQLEPMAVSSKRMIKRNNTQVSQVLAQWSNSGRDDCTWEDFNSLKTKFPTSGPWV
ncbi:Ty3/gypsy retrotransposon protein [Quillaja saponaria]|uniref:Ty3/gypsy retrotransposon protein n=1 Tax=Quillaja saponaria TaxID=32244 RepID=A0AAD7PYS3_QUISA|nr:Ty3/gypsy retrotransposon protein [Quillaja saponaria]